jgi:chaperonin GroEL (HSP60 family)
LRTIENAGLEGSVVVAEGSGDFGYNAKQTSMDMLAAGIIDPKITCSIENAARLLE